jgi:hypothetical protein
MLSLSLPLAHPLLTLAYVTNGQVSSPPTLSPQQNNHHAVPCLLVQRSEKASGESVRVCVARGDYVCMYKHRTACDARNKMRTIHEQRINQGIPRAVPFKIGFRTSMLSSRQSSVRDGLDPIPTLIASLASHGKFHPAGSLWRLGRK